MSARGVSVIIPAFAEAGRIGRTVRAAALLGPLEIIVVDDGSADGTGREAADAGAAVMRLESNRGKGEALARGLAAAEGEILLLLDADLGDAATEGAKLLAPVLAGQAEMTVAVFPPAPGHRGGFGAVRALAAWGLRRARAGPMRAPLSGQRAMTRQAWERIGKLDRGFGIEMGLNLDAARLGLRVLEVETAMSHRLTGRDWAGFRHRFRQFRDVLAAILRRPPGRRS